MRSPDNIHTEEDFQRYVEKHNYTNNGTLGWFPDSTGNLHYYENIQKWSKEDKRRYKQAQHEPYEYWESAWCLLRPGWLQLDPNQTLAVEAPEYKPHNQPMTIV